jgi:hypothetical protein
MSTSWQEYFLAWVKIFWVGLEQGFVLGVGDLRREGRALLQDGPELIALLNQLIDLRFQLGDEVAGVGGAGDEFAVAGEANAANDHVWRGGGHAARLSAVTAP